MRQRWGDVAISSWASTGAQSPLEPLEGALLRPQLDFGLLASRDARMNFRCCKHTSRGHLLPATGNEYPPTTHSAWIQCL